jgi:hypothetical protein
MLGIHIIITVYFWKLGNTQQILQINLLMELIKRSKEIATNMSPLKSDVFYLKRVK